MLMGCEAGAGGHRQGIRRKAIGGCGHCEGARGGGIGGGRPYQGQCLTYFRQNIAGFRMSVGNDEGEKNVFYKGW